MLEEALGQEDDYQRLQKITEGIKFVSQSLSSAKTFYNSTLIKQIICCYPFNEEAIKSILDQCFNQFKQDPKFIIIFHKALSEVSMLQEYRNILSSFSPNKLNGQTFKEQLKQGQIPFCRQVIDKLIIAKKFSCFYLKHIFFKAEEYKCPLEQMAQIFKLYIINTKDDSLHNLIIDIYEELKLSVFKDAEWIAKCNQEIENYFIQSKIKVPQKLIDSKISFVKNKNKKILKEYLRKSSIILDDQLETYSPTRKQKHINYKVTIQHWLCNIDIPIIDIETYEYITNLDNLSLILSFILNPNKIDVISKWSQTFNCEDKHSRNWYKQEHERLSRSQTIRSYQTVQMFIKNLSLIEKILSNFFDIIFKTIYESIINSDIIINLNHLAQLIDQLIIYNPQKCMYFILDFNLLFSLSIHIQNNKITTLLCDIINLEIDKFKLGYYLQEQIWKYLDYTNWFSFLIHNIINQSIINEQCYKEFKTLKIDGILAFVKLLKPQKNSDVILSQDLATPIEYSDEQQQINSSQWFLDNNPIANQIMEDNIKDIDNLKQYGFETQSNQDINNFQDKIPSLSLTYSKGFFVKQTQLISPKFIGNTNNLPILQNKTFKSESVDSQCYLRTRNRSLVTSSDGFSTTKLVSIYPRRNIDLQFTNFETIQSFFIYNTLTIKGGIQIIKIIIQSIFKSIQVQQQLNEFQKKLFIDFIQRQFLNDKLIIFLFKIYLYNILSQDKLAKLSQECALIINSIYEKSLHIQQSNLIKQLKECFLEVVDVISKKIIELKTINNIWDFYFIQHQLLTTLVGGLQYFTQYNPDKDDRNVFKYVNETVMHILIIWFFDSQQNTIFQTDFVKLLAILFSKAPHYQLQNILFHVGLLTSLFNSYTSYNKNGCKNIAYSEGLYMHLAHIVYIISSSISYRELFQLQSNLESSLSWKGLQEILPQVSSIFLQQLNKLMGYGDVKLIHIKLKLDSKQGGLIIMPTSKSSIRGKSLTKLSINKDEIIQSKLQTKEISPTKNRNLIRFRTKGSIKAL